MNFRLITIILILTTSCQTKTSSWKTLDFGAFKLKAPNEWKKFEQKGIDSYVGGLTNGKDSLWFDYGWYSSDIGNEDPKKYKFRQDTINGLIARIVIPVHPGDGHIRMFIPVNNQDKFSISGYNIIQLDTILKIYKSIVFRESDTSKNRQLATEEFRIDTTGIGQTLYKQNCASCHTVHKNLTGPALSNRIQLRSVEWIYKFLTNRQTFNKDTANLNLKKQFGLDCYIFKNLTKEDVVHIVDYIKSK